MNLRDNLGPIIWPGEPSSTPKGWEMPIKGKKLKIGVPPKRGFNEFVDVKYNNATSRTELHGYCIDVFEAVVNALPFGLAYEFSAFAKPNGDINGTYDDLVYQVHLGVFPKGSPLVPDISKAILNVIERGTTKEIEKKLFRQVTNYQDFNSQVSSNVLGLESFWGLFLIAGVASLSALIVFSAIFIYQQRQIITDSDRVDSIWEKVLEIREGDHVVDGACEASTEINLHPSPSTYSIHTVQSDLAFLGEQETPPREFGSTNQPISDIELGFVAHQETPNYSS
ncbi:hypothetical protein FEM48_Zijuj03G0141600 [Ziziphus jujuba var. spinosa]|uniref:Uncharacterized protein n=1 Tax=Ziziphus jujuba var. spinosa TaxID=714518 RepID=A0A978VQS1_ZIZJJ|nr:hypothetical protein FEM48_Zijuj03G0141600 [Ziziphus jujuba var. spinosa]